MKLKHPTTKAIEGIYETLQTNNILFNYTDVPFGKIELSMIFGEKLADP